MHKKKNDILLVTTPPWGANNPPVGLGYLATYLKEKGYAIEVFDFNIDFFNHSPEVYRNLWHVENKNYWSNENTFSILRKIYDQRINTCIERMVLSGIKIIGFSVVDPKERFTIEMINRIKGQDKDNSIRIILGGPACSTSQQRKIFLDNVAHFIDGFVIGEGEEALCDVIDAVKNGRRLCGIPGVLAVEKGRGLDSEYIPRPPISNLDTVPFPRYEEFKPELYASKSSLILEWSRGCIGNCSFCKGRALTGHYRFKSPRHIIEELKFHANRNVNNFTICDNLINGNPKQLEELCEHIIAEGLEIRWNCQGIPLPTMTKAILSKMVKAGCYRMQWGVESGSDKVLHLMNKRHFTVQEAERVIRDSHTSGISTEIFIIVGFPGETSEDFKKTEEFIKKNKDYIDVVKSINILHIIFGTDLYESPDKYGVILPKVDLHYKWHTKDRANTTEVRNERAKRLVALVSELGIPFLETNFMEGKEREGEDIAGENLSIEKLQQEINKIQTLDIMNELASPKKKAIDILLAICPPFGTDMPPLGLAYLAGYLKSKGYNPKVVDFNVKIYNSLNQDLKDLWQLENVRCWSEADIYPKVLESLEGQIRWCVDKILSIGAPIIGFSVNQSNMVFTIEAARRIKRQDKSKVIIFGGPGCYWRKEPNPIPVGVYNHTTRECMIYPGLVDAFIIGEGEETLWELLERIKTGEPLAGIKGAVVFDGSGYVKLIPRQVIKDIDSIAFPYFEDYNLDDYSEHKLPFLMSRGCIGNCAFCNDRPMVGAARSRSARNVFAEIKNRIEKTNIRYFHSVDLLINANLKQLGDFCDMIIAAKYDICWTGQAMVRRDMDFDYLLKMKHAGCDSLVYGCESFSNEVLQRMGKYFTVENAERMLGLTHKAGIVALTNIIVGFPGEGEKEFKQTHEFLKRNSHIIDKISSVQTLHLTTGSDIEVCPEKYGIILPEVEPWFRWYTEDGNTYEVRKNRLKILKALLSEEQHKSINKINLYEDNIEQQKIKLKQANGDPKSTIPSEVNEQIENLKNEIRRRDKIIREKDREFQEIYKSRGWRFVSEIRRIKQTLGFKKRL